MTNKKRPPKGPAVTSVPKRISMPPRMCEETDDKIDACHLYRSRLKFADNSPHDFISEVILQKFPLFRSARYRSVIKETPLAKELMYTTSVARVEATANTLIHSVV